MKEYGDSHIGLEELRKDLEAWSLVDGIGCLVFLGLLVSFYFLIGYILISAVFDLLLVFS